MNKHIYCIVLLSLLFAACNDKEGDFSGRETLSGRLGYQDIYAGDGQARPLGHKLVKLAYSPSDTLNYITSDSTDAQGYFLFENLTSGKSYDLFYEDSIGGLRYLAFVSKTAPAEVINLLATYDASRQNGVYIETKVNGQPAGNVRICLFNNQTLFNADTCNNNYRSDNSDISGRKTFYNLSAGTYYIRGYKKIGNDQYLATAPATTVDKAGVAPLSLNLEKVEAINGLKVTIQDKLGLPVAGIKVGIYNSYTTYHADTLINTSLFNGNTAADGSITFPSLSPTGHYYARARFLVGTVVIAGSDSAEVKATGISPLPVKVFQIP